jgi:membrane associated rhomboid family serine protease
MIPIGDSNPLRRTPVMNWLLIVANALVFFYELTLPPRGLDRFFLTWGVIPQNVLAALAQPLAPGSLRVFETLLTSQFIHGGWLHLLGNMLFLYIFGDNIEDVLGRLGYLVFYLICGIAAVLAQVFVLAPFMGRYAIPTFGASGAIAGVLGGYLVLYPLNRVSVLFPVLLILIPFDLPAFVIIGWWFVQQFFYGLMTLTPSAANSGGVAFWAHVGGFLIGMILIVPFIEQARRRARWLRWQ